MTNPKTSAKASNGKNAVSANQAAQAELHERSDTPFYRGLSVS